MNGGRGPCEEDIAALAEQYPAAAAAAAASANGESPPPLERIPGGSTSRPPALQMTGTDSEGEGEGGEGGGSGGDGGEGRRGGGGGHDDPTSTSVSMAESEGHETAGDIAAMMPASTHSSIDLPSIGGVV